MFNEIDDDFDDVAIRTFKVSLPAKHGLKKSLTGKPANRVRHLMDQIDKHKRVEENQQQGKGKVKVIPQEMRDFESDQYNNNQPRNDFAGQSGLPLLKWLTWCSKNQYTKSWRKSRTSHSLNGQIRWEVTL